MNEKEKQPVRNTYQNGDEGVCRRGFVSHTHGRRELVQDKKTYTRLHEHTYVECQINSYLITVAPTGFVSITIYFPFNLTYFIHGQQLSY